MKVGIHTHIAESKAMANRTQEKYGLTEVELLESIGFLGPDVLAAYCIHLSEGDMMTMARHKIKVSYNPIANMKIAVAIP